MDGCSQHYTYPRGVIKLSMWIYTPHETKRFNNPILRLSDDAQSSESMTVSQPLTNKVSIMIVEYVLWLILVAVLFLVFLGVGCVLRGLRRRRHARMISQGYQHNRVLTLIKRHL